MDPIRVPPEMFRFTAGDRAGLYVSVLHAFSEANERLETALGLDDVRARLRSVGWLDALPDEDLVAALVQLRAWGLVDVAQNHSERYRTASEYERRNLQYSLTRHGEAAFAGVAHAMGLLASTGALQTAVLDAISDRLGDLVHLADAGPNRRIFSTLTELEGHLAALRGNTKQFNGELQRLLRAEGPDLGTFHEVKASTVAYLQEFVTDLEHRARAIATRIRAVEEGGVGELQQRALLGAELPRLSGPDPGPAWLELRRTRWDGLRAWFLPENASTPRVEQLHLVARRAIITLLQVLDRSTGCGRRRSASAQPGTPIWRIPTPSWSVPRPPGRRLRPSKSRRCSGRRVGPSGSAAPAGSGTSRRSGPPGRSRRWPNAPSWRPHGACSTLAALSGCPPSAGSTMRSSNGCSTCSAGPSTARPTAVAPVGAPPATGGSRSSSGHRRTGRPRG